MPDLSQYFLITDMDGTLLPDNKVLLKEDKDAIDRFRKDGGKFTVATGRTLQAMEKFLAELKIDIPAVMYNGSLIYDIEGKKPLYTHELEPGAEKIAIDILNKFPDTGCEVLRLDNIYVVCNNEYEQRHVKICGVDPVYTPIDGVPTENWHKILFADSPEKITEIAEFVKDKDYPVDFVRSDRCYFEILPKGSSKGAALKEYRRLADLSGMKVIAAGDYNNDIEMLEEADIGVCPKNAQPDVKDISDVILSKTSNEGAIAGLIDLIYSGKI